MAQPPPPPHTYIGIPPPPLPEFRYLARAAPVEPSARDDESDSPPILDGADERWEYRKATSHTEAAKVQLPKDDVPPLAVYHICRICLRPRSARYHQEHPIPINGVPPPPGICRRCRVVSVDDRKPIAEVTVQSESNDIKLGVKSLVPDADCFTNEEMRSKRANCILERVERVELEPPPPAARSHHSKDSRKKEREEIVYRHVHITVPPPPQFPHHSNPQVVPPEPEASTEQDAQDAAGSVSRHSSRHIYAGGQEIYARPQTVPPPSSPPFAAAAALRKTSTAKAPSSSSAATSVRSRHTSIRRESNAERQTSGPTEHEIRKLARDEVVRYRQAERKLEAHKDSYAHGRLIPVEQERIPVSRRIEQQVDVPEKMPWHTNVAETRRDSAFALPGRQKVYSEREKEVVWACRSKEVGEDAHRETVQAPSSSVSSDKTRWPGAEVKRTYRITEQDLHTVTEEDKKKKMAKDAPSFGTAENHEVFEIIERREQSEERRPNEETRYYKITRRSSDTSESAPKAGVRADYRSVAIPAKGPPASSSRWTDRDYWEYDESTRTANKLSDEKVETLVATKHGDRIVGRLVQTADGSEMPREKVLVLERIGETTQDLPYPADDNITPMSMPSPSSHASRPTRKSKPNDHDKEYFYMERTVEPLDGYERRRSEIRPGDDYYREASEYLHRRKPQQAQTKPSQAPQARPEVKQRRPSDVSSRVRFANKLDISPTPPGSDASSAEFRNFGGKKKEAATAHGGDLTAEYEHRGRQRSRTPSRAGGYYYERDFVRSRERGYRPADTDDRDRTPRAADRWPYAPSETATGLSTLPSNIRPIARALSESPSREKLRAAAMRQRSDGLPPYVEPESPGASVTVEDGSTLTSESSGSYRRGMEVRREQGGRRLKR